MLDPLGGVVDVIGSDAHLTLEILLPKHVSARELLASFSGRTRPMCGLTLADYRIMGCWSSTGAATNRSCSNGTGSNIDQG